MKLTKLLFYVIATIAIGATIGCQASSQQVTETPPQYDIETRHYETPGFSLEYPKGWIVTESMEEYRFLVCFQPYKASPTGVAVGLYFYLNPDLPLFDYPKDCEVRDILVDGLPTKERTYTVHWTSDTVIETMIALPVEDLGITYVFLYKANSAEEYDEHRNCFRLMVDTFRVEET